MDIRERKRHSYGPLDEGIADEKVFWSEWKEKKKEKKGILKKVVRIRTNAHGPAERLP